MDNIEGSGSDVTVIAVIDPSATQGSGATIYSWGTDGTVNFGLSSNSTNSYLLYWGSASGSVDGPAAVATAGLPQIISEVKSGTSASAYVNGVLSGTTTVPATIAAAPATLAMGNGANPSFGFAGQIAELLVYNRALSNSERQSIEAGLTTLYVGSTGGIPNTWLLEYFGTTNVNVNTDYDGNGQTVTQDYTAGFDPVDFFNGRAFAILPSGASNTFTYDLSGRLIKTSYSNGVNFSLTNDPAGNITAVSNYGPIVQWRSANGLPADGTGIGADSEILGNDGIPNLAKYAFGLSPFATFTGNCPVVSITGLSGYLRLAYTRPDPAPSDIVYTVQVSGDGINWSSGSGATLNVSTTVNDGIATVVVQDATPIGSPSFGRQIRLAIQRVPQP